MIKTHWVNNRFAPVIVCDQCGQRIEDAATSLALTPRNAAIETPDMPVMLDCFHIHKGACCHQFEAKYHRPMLVGSIEMSKHLVQLAHNVRMGTAQIDQAIAADDDMRANGL